MFQIIVLPYRADRSAFVENAYHLARRRSLLLAGCIAFVAALLVAERSGLPSAMAFSGTLFLLFGAVILATLGHGSLTERNVFGEAVIADGYGPAVTMGAVVFIINDGLMRSLGATSIVSATLAACLGLVLTAMFLRLRENGQASGRSAAVLAALAGLGTSAAALAAAGAAVPLVIQDMSGVGLPAWAVLVLVFALPLVAIAAGGFQSAMGLMVMAGALVLAAMTLVLLIGIGAHGAPPLPDLASPATMLTIAEARARWLPDNAWPPFLVVWPTFGSWITRTELPAFCAGCALGCIVGLGFGQMARLDKVVPSIAALCGACLTPLVLVALGGYAVESVGVSFVNASGQRPPPALLQASVLGVVEICGARPATADALRIACGFAVRDVARISTDQIRLSASILPAGTPLALGYGVVLDTVARSATVLLRLAGVVALFAVAAVALGRDLFGSGRKLPGQASLRIALVRIGALVGIGLSVMLLHFGGLPPSWLFPFVAVSASVAVIAQTLPSILGVIRSLKKRTPSTAGKPE